ncbi:hypothetical protein [Longimicrobium sp.]|uniref:hypothetical protein n=1 Tax=Longimicrobium sp. TaxID=2029185 RepID=UPI002F949D77
MAEAVTALGPRPVGYKSLRNVAWNREPSADVRKQIARWGWAHVRGLIDRLLSMDADVAADEVQAILEQHADLLASPGRGAATDPDSVT